MTKKTCTPLLVLVLAVCSVIVDQLLKLAVIQFLMPVGSHTLIPNFLSLDYLENRGAAFGIFQNRQWMIAVITGIICIFVVAALFRYKHHDVLSWAACTLILGGGVGNIIDRVTRGYVVDFIHFHFFPYIFNFADICVVIGVALLILHIFFNEQEESKQKPAEKAEEKDG